MVLKLKHELGVGDVTLFERRSGCGGIPKLVFLLVLVFFFFLIMSCFSPNKINIFIPMILFGSCKRYVLQTNNNYSFTQDASSTNY
jgi:hypothetical protein